MSIRERALIAAEARAAPPSPGGEAVGLSTDQRHDTVRPLEIETTYSRLRKLYFPLILSISYLVRLTNVISDVLGILVIKGTSTILVYTMS
jgi:hypothetical protein